jgi:glycosyltransferase involved in cell wall biosynthesis
MAKVSVIIPSRNERFLLPTVEDLLKNARGDMEIIAIADGYWPNPPLPDDPRIKIIHKGKAQGMRNGINSAALIATGDYFLKIDGHCMVSEGYDVELQKDCSDHMIVVPRRYSLDAEKWEILHNKPPVDMHYLSYPFERPDDEQCGLHGNIWKERAAARLNVLFDDEMSSQGSCWFMHRKHWDWLGPLEIENYGTFVQEFQELGNKTLLGGADLKVDKRVWYAHLHKGKQYGRGYTISTNDHRKGHAFCTRHWMLDEPWPKKVHNLRWLIEKFWPVPTWPKTASGALDWDEVERQNTKRLRQQP